MREGHPGSSHVRRGPTPASANGGYPMGTGSAEASGSSVYPGTQRSTSARNGASHSSWHSTPVPAVDTRWISTKDGGTLNRRDTLDALMSVTGAAAPRSHS